MGVRKVEGVSLTAISNVSVSGCTMLTTHLKYGSLLYIFTYSK